MRFKEFAKTNFKVSVIGMGTYYDAFWIATAMLLRVQRHRSRILAALKAGLDRGINFIDTAEIYQSESIVADAIAERKRDELFIATKVWSNHLKPEAVAKACKRSLSKLRVKYIDLYQIHFPSSRVPIVETMGALERLVDEGLIRAIGISNFSYQQMVEARSAMKRHELSSTQMDYSLLNRDVERDILPLCEKERIALIAYYPIAHGKLAKGNTNSPVKKLANKHGVTSSGIALGWLASRSDVVFPIPRASRSNHIIEDASAGDLTPNPEEMEELNLAYPVKSRIFS